MRRTIPDLLAAAVADAPERAWLLHEDRTFTYAEAQARVHAVAAALREHGVRRGDRVLTPAPNTPETLFAWLATAHLGAVFVPVNPRSAPAELAGIVEQVEPVAHGLEGLRVEAGAPPPPVAARPEDPAVLIPTSGTTGRSKLVTQTHRAYVMAGEGFPWWTELTADDRLMTALPLFHVNAPAYSVLGSVAARASLVLLPRFSPGTFLDAARRYGATEFNAIGAMLEMLMRQPERPDDADSPLRLCYTGPTPPKDRQLAIERRFGLRIVCGYAMSESPYGTIWARGTRPYGTIGSPRQHPELGTVNEARVVRDGRVVGAGEEGELQLRNPAVMLGYWRMPEATAEVLLPDGWLRTGDLVRDNGDGTYTFVGRLKEVIRRRGENLSPAEVEEALESHPSVAGAAVVAVPSELTEDDVKAFVVLGPGAEPDLAAVRDWAAARLAPFKLPRYIETVAELPLTPTGRVAKHLLPRDRRPGEVDFEAPGAPPPRPRTEDPT